MKNYFSIIFTTLVQSVAKTLTKDWSDSTFKGDYGTYLIVSVSNQISLFAWEDFGSPSCHSKQIATIEVDTASLTMSDAQKIAGALYEIFSIWENKFAKSKGEELK